MSKQRNIHTINLSRSDQIITRRYKSFYLNALPQQVKYKIDFRQSYSHNYHEIITQTRKSLQVIMRIICDCRLDFILDKLCFYLNYYLPNIFNIFWILKKRFAFRFTKLSPTRPSLIQTNCRIH